MHIESFTSRDNPVPVNGVVLRLKGDFRLNVTGTCELQTTLDELQRDDVWATVSPRFSAPKLRIGQPFQQLKFAASWHDPAPTRNDFYMLKVQQANGQMAWSSPIWFADE